MFRQQKFSIRKTTLGVASLAIASIIVSQAQVSAQTIENPVDTTIEAPIASEPVQPVVTETTAENTSSLTIENAPQAEPVATNLAETVQTTDVKINEVESNDPTDGPDWAEIFNYGSETIDISGWKVADDKMEARITNNEVTPLPQGTLLEPGKAYVFEENKDFTFGLGKEDQVNLYDAFNNLIDTITWTAHAKETFGLDPVTLEAKELDQVTKGEANASNTPNQPETPTPATSGKVVINEVDSAPSDWVELFNPSETDIDLSGYEIRDNSDDHRWKFLENTILKAKEFFVIDDQTK